MKTARYICLYQYGLLGVLTLLGISMGLWHEILGPTLPNLSSKLNISYETFGYAISIGRVGNIFSLLFAAIIYDTYPYLVHYLMFGECFIAGISTIIIPWCSNLWMVALLLFIQSGCENALNNGGQSTILRTFKERSIGKMQIYHLGYGIGAVLSGLISQQFITKKNSVEVKLTKYCEKNNKFILNISEIFFLTNNSNYTKDKEKGFEYIYLIAGIFAICSSFIFLFYTAFQNPDEEYVRADKKKESWLKKIDPRYIAEGKICLWSVMTVLLFLYYFFYIFGLSTFLPYVVVYAIDPCKTYSMSQNLATYLYTALNVCFLTGRVIGSFLLDFSPTISLLSINILNIFFILILVFLSDKYSLALWIGACGMRFCNSIVYPSGTSYVNKYIVVTSSLISLAFLGSSIGSLVGLSFGGYVVDNYPSNYITYSCLSGMSLLMLTIIVIVILGKKHGVRDFTKKLASQKKDNIELQ